MHICMSTFNVLAFVNHKNKKHQLVVMDGVEYEVATENNDITNAGCLSMTCINKKIKQNKKNRSDERETIIIKVKFPSKVKR